MIKTNDAQTELFIVPGIERERNFAGARPGDIQKRSKITTDPLKFWKANSQISWKYPNLAKIVRRYHCPPPGSAARTAI